MAACSQVRESTDEQASASLGGQVRKRERVFFVPRDYIKFGMDQMPFQNDKFPKFSQALDGFTAPS